MREETPAGEAAGANLTLWLGVLVLIACAIVLVAERRRARIRAAAPIARDRVGPDGGHLTEPAFRHAPIAQADGSPELTAGVATAAAE